MMDVKASNGDATAKSLPITIRSVNKAYGPVVALKDINLDIKSGEFMTLLGPSGSGKTTLLMVLAGFVRSESGSVKFGDEEVIAKAPHERGIGMMFQNYALFPHMSVSSNIAYPLKVRKWSKERIEAAVGEVLATVQMSSYQSRRISELSGGQKQRVALARAIVFKPQILLMDEPLSALDKNLREMMQVELRSMHERLGMTTVLVTHDQREALTMSDRIAVLRDGAIAQIDSSAALYNAPATAFIAGFIGESTLLKVSIRNGSPYYRDQVLDVADSITGQESGFLVLRPEKLDVVGAGQRRPDHNCFDGSLERVLFQGESSLAFIRLAGGELVTVRRHLNQRSNSDLPALGSPIVLSLHKSESRIVRDDMGQ
jgi:putative spermidine/putrescine transport system ATP-binding protein